MLTLHMLSYNCFHPSATSCDDSIVRLSNDCSSFDLACYAEAATVVGLLKQVVRLGSQYHLTLQHFVLTWYLSQPISIGTCISFVECRRPLTTKCEYSPM